MNEQRPFAPPETSARLHSLGRLPFGFGPRFFVALLLGLLWVVPAWWSPRIIAALFLWDFLVIAGFVLDLVHLPRPREIEVSRIWEHPPSLATPSELVISIENFGKVALWCGLVDETATSLRNPPPALEMTVAAGAREQISYRILPRERGDVRMGRLFVRYQSRFGFAERWSAAEISQTVRVLPDLEQARRHALYLIRSKQVEMEKRRKRQRGQGREFESLRDYRQGDDLRDICWTATARRHNLTTRVFEIERSQVVWIVLDAGRLLRAEVRQEDTDLRLSKLDYAVNAALSLAQVASQCGDKVGLLAYGRSVQQNIAAGRGALHLRTIVDSLAQVRGEASEADHSSAARVLLNAQHRRSLVVWITDFAETPTLPEVIEYAMQITRRHLVVFSAMSQPDLADLAQTTPQTPEDMYRHAAALEISHRRDLLLRGLRQRGIFAFELVPGMLASSLVNQYLDIKDRNLL
ncbi:MAG TPA: DUF58 domain-containing protein [Candidatus Acidoferrales bacterium]|nr:DUF58 domain-containing protein [Candidatus Acidoferrales bacterium]